ncbi:MAG: hypothetical protein DKM50_13175 [Candidatus Margulisiibacteriota bacterium]|nr:MAG: hypothetical protein A2X43_13860 [Candidatus Margulisbacteria bacterium GWD2_39_127]OGI05537.1 MAG: hypothetical protein A2X42_00590 [Candidatus Margulisbacteria bacterium GWF2_38_17]OGI08382.1 MAG: hypothetical protein A2X41_10750 [Candidatus Margulisbacteria bacterium GWE2_39_32]PZM77353.1 MAG: hypothetical protein DKM50_13175 [Candidatus Margulisiibacteriota bacterium]HAR63137.1 hypothetical protein [Candidatus Margulisiibacteriota bacterium]
MKKIIVIASLLLSIAGVSFADLATPYLYTSFTGSGMGKGGLRLDFGSGFVADGTIGILDENTNSYFADFYYGSWGVAVAGAKGSTPAVSFMYALEKAINKDISAGICTDLVTYQKDADLKSFSVWDVYVVMPL